jgi:DNA-binding transcriptional LysR family regulator
MLQSIADAGSFAAAARAIGVVPSALTYRVRQIEDALDVLLFDRSSRQAKLTEAGRELLREGARLLEEIDAVANRVKRVATGWEPQLTIAVDGIISKSTMMELCDNFLAQNPPTRIKLRDETLSGTLEALTSGQADLAIGVADPTTHAGVHGKPLGDVSFVYAVAPHHPLATAPEPLKDDLVRQHRAVAVADSIQRGRGLTLGCWVDRTCSPWPPCRPNWMPRCAAWVAALFPTAWRAATLRPGAWSSKKWPVPSGWCGCTTPGARPPSQARAAR